MIGALAIGLVLAAVDVGGDATCPAPAEVSRRVAEMNPPAPGGHAPVRRARLSRIEGGVIVELLDAGGERLAERKLDALGGCDDLAAAAAVVIAAWEAELDPRLTARVVLPATPAPAAPPVVASRAAPAPRRSPPRFDVGLGLIASVTGGQLAAGARLGGWIAPAAWRLGLGMAASGTTARSESVGPGEARWSRYVFAAGPDARFNVRGTMLGAHAQLLAAALRVEGAGLETNASGWTAQFGTGAGVRVGRSWGTAAPWLGADLLFWPGRDRLVIDGVTAQGELPRVELQLALGLSLGRFP